VTVTPFQGALGRSSVTCYGRLTTSPCHIVHHGRFFSPVPLPDLASTPSAEGPIKTVADATHPQPLPTPKAEPNGTISNGNGTRGSKSKQQKQQPESQPCPYLSFGFIFNDRLVYISDVSHIPDDVWPILTSTGAKREGGERRIPLLILDCLRFSPFTSHFGIAQAVETARKLRPERTLLIGFSHDVGVLVLLSSSPISDC
jgi:hypothetical protein